MMFLFSEYTAGVHKLASPRVVREEVGVGCFHHVLYHCLYSRPRLSGLISKGEHVGKWGSDERRELADCVGSSRAASDVDITH
jgi:hypothetical protein